jgi:hypothetical protein
MSASRDALIRAVDALQGPQGATPEEPVAPAKCLENQGRSHTGHRSHSETTDHDQNQESACLFSPAGEQRRGRFSSKVYPPSVAPVAHVDSGIDSEGKNRGHTTCACGPLWPPDSRTFQVLPGVPPGWIQGVARLGTMPPPCDYPPVAWQQLIIDAERFLDLWGAQAALLDWRDWELFGCHRRAPWGRIQGMGLALLLRGRELAALTKSEAAIRTTSGARQPYHRKPRDPLDPRQRCLVWELDNDRLIGRSTSASIGSGRPRDSGGGVRDARL